MIFTNRKSADKYLESDFAKELHKAYETIEPVKIEILDVLKESTF